MESQPRSRVVVGVDGTSAGLRAVAFAATEAERRGAELLLVHAHHFPAMPNPPFPAIDYERVRDHGRIALETAETHARLACHAGQVETLLIPGRAARTLVAQSEGADLLVVGRRERKTIHAMGGSTSNAVAARAHCPVVCVNPSWTEQHDGRVVVGVDGSPGGRDALAYAFEYASTHHLRLAVLRSWELPVFLRALPPSSPDEAAQWKEQAELALAEDLAGWRSDFPDVDVLPHVEHSFNAADSLITHSKRSRLLVIGARGAGGVPGLHLGWTAHAVLSYAECPVAIVPRVGSRRRAGRRESTRANVSPSS